VPVSYCEVCGVLIASGSGGPGTICDRCLSSRKVIVSNPDSGSDSAPPAAPQRVQFACPTCRSLLQLPPVTKRTKIKCPKCQGEFALHPDGKIEATGGPTTKKLGAQENLLADLKPKGPDLDALLERVPQKKGDALPSVLESEGYVDFQDSGSSGGAPPIPGTKTRERGDGYAILPESTGPKDDAPLDFAEPDSSEKIVIPAPRPEPREKAAPPAEKAAKPRIQTARRTREKINEQRREAELRAQRAAEAQKYTIALLERKKQRTVATTKLAALVGGPLIVAGLCLVSTNSGGGFAVNGPLGSKLTSLGEVARNGASGLLGLFK
jgi:LSD1 subclass zinc finger protein